MNIRSYLDTLTAQQRKDFATDLDVTVVYLCQLASGFRKASAALCVQIERTTNGAVTRSDMRPDLFGPIAAQAQAESESESESESPAEVAA